MNLKVLLTTLNAKYIHKNLALRWLYVARCKDVDVILKEYTIKHDLNQIVEEILSLNVDVIAFSVYIWNIEPITLLIEQIKAKSNIHIIVGGPEVTYDSYDLLEKGVDAISLGEGEVAFWEYIKMLKSDYLYEVAGIYTKAFPNTQIMRSDLAFNESLENPYFLKMDEKDMDKRYFYLETSRGCPYQCEYCLSSTDSKVRMFSETYIFSILEKLAASKVRIVKLLDRTFNVHPKRALRIARYMNTHCVNQIFQFEIVAETLSEELLCFFEKEADIRRFRFEIGVQSFHEKTLHSVGRMQNNKRLQEVITRLRKANVVMHVDLIAGLPYESFNGFKESFNQLYALYADEIQLGILKLLKGTKLKEKSGEYGFIYHKKPPYNVLETKWVSAIEMEELHDCAHAVEKYYNNGRCRCAIDTILELGLYSDAFSLFDELGKHLKKIKKPYQPHDLFKILKQVMGDADEMLIDGILNYDYYAIFKQKPKMFLKNKISINKRKAIMEEAIIRNIADEKTLHHYGHIDTIYYKHQLGYQFILYSSMQTYPNRWFILQDVWEEIQ